MTPPGTSPPFGQSGVEGSPSPPFGQSGVEGPDPSPPFSPSGVEGPLATATPLLEVRDLCTELTLGAQRALAVDHVSFTLAAGQTLGLVGESGCGKSMTALSVLRLLREPPARITGGHIFLAGDDLLAKSEAQMCGVRGQRLSMVFQEPMTSLNPLFRIGAQVSEPLRLHQRLGRRDARTRAIELLRQVGIPAPELRVDAYPHELSGGMRQRVMLAMALACNPSVLVADEPTTALDVTVQAQVLRLLKELQRERGLAVLLITHDLGVVAETCDHVAVMYAGRLVEQAAVKDLFERPAHPYTHGLLSSLPSRNQERAPGAHLAAIPGQVPPLFARPSGCRFRNRCARATELCAQVDPPLELKRPGQLAACHHPVPEA